MMFLWETTSHVLSAQTRSKVSVFSSPNHCLQEIYEDQYSWKGQEHSNNQPPHIYRAFCLEKVRTISIAENCGVYVNRICKLLQTRVTPATSHAPASRKVISHGQNVITEKICAIQQLRDAKKYGKQYEIKILFRHFYYLKALVFIDELKKIG